MSAATTNPPRAASSKAAGKATDPGAAKTAAPGAASAGAPAGVAQAMLAKDREERRRWLRLFLLLPPVLCALIGFIAGERIRETRRIADLAEAARQGTFDADRMVPLGRVAMPIDGGAAAMTLTMNIDVAMPDGDTAYATRRGANRSQIKDAVIVALADAMLIPGIQNNLGDAERLADLLARDLRRTRPDLAGVRVSGVQVIDANGVAIELPTPPGS